ncbi:MAG: hypothetical protein K2P44_01770 [Lachnospiraceae bacterium]|nr:hypothetical protein [Lachnospiraceae bacterium]
MEYMNGKGAIQLVRNYIESEMSEYKKVSEKELNAGGVAPEARAAFNRKPYCGFSSMNLKNRPVLR